MQYADIASRDCKHCWKYVYNEKTGKPEKRHGKLIRRPKGTTPPCMRGLCKKGSPDQFKTLLPHNVLAYEHYQECKATGRFPDDPVVRRNARLIKMVEDETAAIARRFDSLMTSMQTMTK